MSNFSNLPKDCKMHFSNLKNFEESPVHYLNSLTTEFDSKSMLMGRALHELVLQDIQPRFYDGIRRGKEWDAVADKDNMLSVGEYNTTMRMAESVLKNTHAVEVLTACCNREKSIEFDLCGVPFAGRVDGYGNNIIMDLKSTKCSKPRKFLSDAHWKFYHSQLALYNIGLGTIPEVDCTIWPESYIVAVENVEPYICMVYRLDDLRLDQGFAKIKEWIETFKNCEQNGYYSYSMEQPILWDGDLILSENE